MTTRAGDALSHVDFTAPQTEFSGVVLQRIGRRDFAFHGAPRTGPVNHNPIYSVRICMGP